MYVCIVVLVLLRMFLSKSHPLVFTELKRHWEDFSHPCDARTSAERGKQKRLFEFSVMSYNILSQDLLCDNAYLYKHCNGCVLDWNYRFSNIIKELAQHSADVSDHLLSFISATVMLFEC